MTTSTARCRVEKVLAGPRDAATGEFLGGWALTGPPDADGAFTYLPVCSWREGMDLAGCPSVVRALGTNQPDVIHAAVNDALNTRR